MSRQSRRSSPRQENNVSRCAKDKTKTARLPRTAAAVTPPAIASTAPLPLSEVVVEKEHLAKQALHNTSCAGCVASVRTLLARPLSDLRMLKALVDEHRDGPRGGAFRLKEAFVNDPKRVEQLLDTFPMSSVLKKVQPIGSAQRCQLHRRLISLSLAGACVGGGYRGGDSGGGGGGGSGGGGVNSRGIGPADSWDWEGAWERMPPNLRNEVATVKASALEAAVHHATDASKFCQDCKYNVVQAHDILMGKIDLEGSENEEEYDEDIFLPFEDRVFEGESGNSEDKLLICDVLDVEDLIYSYEDFSAQDSDSSNSGQQRHASSLEDGQREVRSILGALVLSQLRSVWHTQTAQVQGEQYLFCLVVDAVRTMLAAHSAARHDDDLMAVDEEERCAAEERLQRRRQKRKEKKRAGKAQLQLSASASASGGDGGSVDGTGRSAGGDKEKPSRQQKRKERKRAEKAQLELFASPSASSGGGGGGGGSGDGRERSAGDASRSAAAETGTGVRREGGGGSGVLERRTTNGTAGVTTAAAAAAAGVGGSPGKPGKKQPLHTHNTNQHHPHNTNQHHPHNTNQHHPVESTCTAPGLCDSRVVSGGSNSGDSRRKEGSTSEAGGGCMTFSGFATEAAASHGAFGAGGLAFQLGDENEEDSDGDDGVDHELITEMERLKTSLKSKSDIDFLRKTLRQNYDRFISQGAGRVR